MKRSFLLIAFGCMGLALYAQPRLSLEDAINTALQNSYDIQLARNSLEISSISNHRGMAGELPVINATANDNEQLTTISQKFSDPSRDTKRSNVGSNNLNAGISGSILLFNGYRVVATKKRLEELQVQNQYLLNAQIQNTIAAVATQYYEVVRQQLFLQTIVQSIDVSKQRLDILQIRKEVGLSNNADIYQAQLDRNALIQSQQTQQLIIDQGRTNLLNLLAVKPDSSVIILDTILVDRSLRYADIQTAIRNNPELLSAEQQIRINEQLEKEATALRYPTVRATTGYNFNNNKSAAGFSLLNQSYGPFLSLNLAVPIYNGGIFKRQQRIADINIRSARVQKENLVLDLETSAVRSYQAYTNAIQQLQTEQENYTLSKQLLDLVLQRFQLGQGTIVDVKLAQQSFESAGFRLVNLNYSAKIAEIELKRLASQLTL